MSSPPSAVWGSRRSSTLFRRWAWGFLVNDLILIPLLVLFLGVTIWALRRDRPRHDRAGPEALAWAAALATVGGLWISAVVVGAGLALLIAASVWNWKLVRSRRTVDPKTVEA